MAVCAGVWLKLRYIETAGLNAVEVIGFLVGGCNVFRL